MTLHCCSPSITALLVGQKGKGLGESEREFTSAKHCTATVKSTVGRLSGHSLRHEKISQPRGDSYGQWLINPGDTFQLLTHSRLRRGRASRTLDRFLHSVVGSRWLCGASTQHLKPSVGGRLSSRVPRMRFLVRTGRCSATKESMRVRV